MNDKQRNRVLGVLFVGVLMGALDIAIIGPAMPAIQAEFGLSPRQLPWLFSIYVLMQMISTPLMAKLSDFYGRRAIYVLDVAIFAVGSVVVAASHGSGMWELLLLGFGWQWLFLINIPLAIVVIALGWSLLPHTRVAASGSFDWLGMLVLAIALGIFTYGLNEFDPSDAAASLQRPAVWVSLLVSAIAWVGLVAIERRAAHPVFPVRLFANRQLAVAFLLTAGAGLGEASTVFLPLLAVLSLGVTASVGSFLLLRWCSPWRSARRWRGGCSTRWGRAW